MEARTKLKFYVFLIALLALVSMTGTWEGSPAFPGYWALVGFVVVSFLLDQTNTRLRVEAAGSISFVIDLAAAILFGGFWGGLVAGSSVMLGQLVRRNPPIKVVFNVSQRLLSVAAAFMVYMSLGGGMPPEYLRVVGDFSRLPLQRDISLFFLMTGTYFAVNTVAVSAVVSFNTGRPFREVWYLNTRGVLGYDLAASTLALLVAWLYTKFGALGLVGVIAPLVIVRYLYGMYRKLEESGRELLDLMVKAIEARDPYTSGHSIRVATLSRAIATELALSPAEVEQVYTSALLHDVGKIHEEFAPLLRKETKLSAEETALLQTHAVKSAELVGMISDFRGKIQDAVRNHHERWDGRGYPDGLAGEAIPLGARIIMVSDTVDAMTTDRPYRKRLPVESVIAELQRHRGAQFDPRLVDLAVNSVVLRRMIAELQTTTERPAPIVREGGSRRVSWGRSGAWRSRITG
jgi:putative nucleotidyltransferase with HDIG domain